MYFFTFILKNIGRRKVRSLLTICGVGIAVGAVVALVGIANGFERSFRDLYEHRNVDLMVVQSGKVQRLGSYLDKDLADRFRRLPGVKAVIAGMADYVVFDPERNIQGTVQGWEPDSLLYDQVQIIAGRKPQAGDRGATIIGSALAYRLDLKVGDKLNLYGEDFAVIGIFESFNLLENNAAVILMEELQRLLGQPNKVTGFQIILEDVPHKAELADQVKKAINEMRNEKTGRPLGLYAQGLRDFVSSTSELKLVDNMAWLTSFIALVIGTVGVLNTMIMSVFERTREIGILRAIGWRRARVVRMILAESILLALVGAVVGAIGAVLLTQALSLVPLFSGLVRGDVAPHVLVLGFVIALAMGLVGGAYPAFRGARLLPTEALRHE